MIFDGYSMADHSFEQNVEYIAKLPELERTQVDHWIEELDKAAGSPPQGFQKFNSTEYRPLIGIDVVRRQIQQLWLRVSTGNIKCECLSFTTNRHPQIHP
ncbi:unnamed protein product [Rotaria magnacalcarata]|nr:unnamed protein product [Rotaria magnacalcarata]CAF5185894.1 unnamed protein product [Rotaria magnacalcarata]CAF5192621.1 unnamed protein product [Rotaria magnacalcarata]